MNAIPGCLRLRELWVQESAITFHVVDDRVTLYAARHRKYWWNGCQLSIHV
jgi:hypothetical protein